MRLPKIKYCPSTLQPGFDTYSPTAQLSLFGSRSKKVSHILPFAGPGKNASLTREYNAKRKTISISGVQEKYSLSLKRNELSLVSTTGSHILKPIPTQRLDRIEDIPANEHVTMQIARQVFGINTAACGMCFFSDGPPAYITKRFDYKPDGTKYQIEDFASLIGKSPEKEGHDYKYNASYLDIANEIKRYVPAATVEVIKLYKLVLFNYFIGNGDAHLKNFALMESKQGDYLLAPAYDLLCTALHIDDANLALYGGLYNGDVDEPSFRSYGLYTGQSFRVFADVLAVPVSIVAAIHNDFLASPPHIDTLIDRSFLSKEAKTKYKEIVKNRHARLQLG